MTSLSYTKRLHKASKALHRYIESNFHGDISPNWAWIIQNRVNHYAMSIRCGAVVVEHLQHRKKRGDLSLMAIEQKYGVSIAPTPKLRFPTCIRVSLREWEWGQ